MRILGDAPPELQQGAYYLLLTTHYLLLTTHNLPPTTYLTALGDALPELQQGAMLLDHLYGAWGTLGQGWQGRGHRLQLAAAGHIYA